MIDLHCHILPGIDDGADSISTSLEMARIAHDDGIIAMACTPHITPGKYDNDSSTIIPAIGKLQQAIDDAGLDLQLFWGADIHVAPEMIQRISRGEWLTLAGTQYFLFEPPHHVLPPNLLKLAKSLLDRGLVPIVTHPERLSWIDKHYDVITALDEMGCPLQITAGAVVGRFGKRPRYWAERLLEEGRVDIIATDAHGVRHRPPLLAEGYHAAARIVGEERAWNMVSENPRLVLQGKPLPPKDRNRLTQKKPFFHKIFEWRG